MKPKNKLLALILTSSSMLFFTNFMFIAAVVFTTAALFFAAGIQEKFIDWLKPLFFVILAVILLQSLTFSGFGLSLKGFYLGILYALRLLALVMLVFLFTQTTTINGLAEAFDFLPINVSEVLILTLSLLPRITKLTKKIVNAQKARGYNFRSINIFKTYLPILIPLFAKILYQSEQMALAMQSRGFENKKSRA